MTMSSPEASERCNADPEGGMYAPVLVNESAGCGLDLTWINMKFSIHGEKVLNGCWGKVGAGQVCAILGPSGAGKSSLLNVISGRQTTSKDTIVEGKVIVGGEVIDPGAFRKNMAYVMQDDALHATVTPREALLFSATMRLPSSTTSAQIAEIVAQLLQAMQLEKCADLLVGSALVKGISGGERKRTSVGVELVTNPALLLCDEPTSGLDSYSAQHVVQLLKGVAAKGCTIVCTVHQPSSPVFALFDSVIFMKEGSVFYHGPPNQATEYFGSQGYWCPKNHNPADFVMSLCQLMPTSEARAKDMFLRAPASLLVSLDQHPSRICGVPDPLSTALREEYHHSFMRQVTVLFEREVRCARRNRALIRGRYIVPLVLGMVVGLVFMNSAEGDNGVSQEFNAHYGGLVLWCQASMMLAGTPTMVTFPAEKPVFLREYTSGAYTGTAYMLSKLLLEMPMTLLQCLELTTLLYLMQGMQGNFVLLLLSSWLMAMCSTSAGMMLGCIGRDLKQATQLSVLIYMPQVLFAGFLIRLQFVPLFLRWAQYLCSLKYMTNLMLLIEFDESLPSCRSSDLAAEACRNVKAVNDVQPHLWFAYALAMVAVAVACRLVGLTVLVQRAKRYY